jgi:arginine utilization protein RocB
MASCTTQLLAEYLHGQNSQTLFAGCMGHVLVNSFFMLLLTYHADTAYKAYSVELLISYHC